MHKVEITGVDTSKLKALSNNEQQELLIKIKDGDMNAREKMIQGNLKLVLSVLKMTIKFLQRERRSTMAIKFTSC